MELIFYDEAAKILAVSIDTLKQAVSRGELTRAGMQGNRQRLIKEQVNIFTGVNPRTGRKKRLSRDALTEYERALWHRYEQETLTPSMPARAIVDEETIRRVAHEAAREEIEKHSTQNFIDAYRGVQEYIRNGVPQGDFFRQHPFLASITYYLIAGASLVGLVAMYNALSELEQQEALAYMSMVDAALESQEKIPNPPMGIDEIRKQREYIARFKKETSAAA
jgi:excisionase family DNA binding protein